LETKLARRPQTLARVRRTAAARARPPAPAASASASDGHAADPIFAQLATAIVRGELAVGAPIPSENELAAAFGVSRPTARQAIHKLAEMELVRVRQGGPTIVLDPNDSADLRVIGLMHQAAPKSATDVLDVAEWQLLSGHVLLAIAARRASAAERAQLVAILVDYCERGAPEAELAAFEERFWKAVARAGGNRLCMFEVNWWFRLLREQPRARHPVIAPPHARRAALLALADRISTGQDPAAFYMQLMGPVLDSIARQADAVTAAAAAAATKRRVK
jgi:DNA-binding FadR family transcriptional regulator